MRWNYPQYPFVEPNGVKPVAELWDDKAGVRVALVVRSDAWPDTSYRICVPDHEGSIRWPEDRMVDMQGDFLQAQALAVAIAGLS